MNFNPGNHPEGDTTSQLQEDSPCAKRTGGLRLAMETLTTHHFSPYKVFVNRKHRTVVVLNPKVGTTSFRYLITRAYHEVLGLKDVSEGRYKVAKKARYFPFASPRDYLHALSNPQQYQYYCFVRNPYARLKSAWVDKFAFGHQEGYPHSIEGKVIHRLRNFAKEHHYAGNEAGHVMPFDTFVNYVEARQTGKRNHHWDEQYSVLLMDRFRYAQIFKMESEFAVGMETIFERLGIPRAWTQKAMEKPQNRSKKVSEAVFTESLAKQALQIYQRDFDVLGYDVESWKGM